MAVGEAISGETTFVGQIPGAEATNNRPVLQGSFPLISISIYDVRIHCPACGAEARWLATDDEGTVIFCRACKPPPHPLTAVEGVASVSPLRSGA
jgi:hypothetical protein